METERLQKILARAGYGSRRACEELIERGRVAVDGRIAQVGDKADPTTQRITVDSEPIRLPQTYTYVMLYKPRGVISTTDDPEERRTVRELVDLPQRLYPVGRLDADSEGLVILTDDGELTQHLTHPRYEQPRVYRVLVIGEPTAETLDRWQRGVNIDDKPVRFDHVKVDSVERGRAWLRITVHEGSKHMIRRAVTALEFPVLRLIRIAMGPLKLGDLRPGRWRYLNNTEVAALRREVGIAADAQLPHGKRPFSTRPQKSGRRRVAPRDRKPRS